METHVVGKVREVTEEMQSTCKRQTWITKVEKDFERQGFSPALNVICRLRKMKTEKDDSF